MQVKELENGRKYYTNCRETTTGWFHNEDTSVWACYKGTKLEDAYTDKQISFTKITKANSKMKKVVYGYGSDTNELNATKDLKNKKNKKKNSVKKKLNNIRFKEDQGEFNIHKSGNLNDDDDLKEISQLDTRDNTDNNKHNLDEDFDKDFNTKDNSNNQVKNTIISDNSKKNDSINLNLNDLIINDSDSSSSSSNLDKKEFDKAFNNLNISTELNSNSDLDNALDVVQDDSISLLKVSPNFTDHNLVAQRINSNSSIGWHATS